jgi:peptidoglycan-associated lipoprotein
MTKSLRFIFPLIIAALLLAGCPRKQAPTPSETALGSGGRGALGGSGDIIAPGDDLGAFGADLEGLEARDLGAGLYNGREMVEGVLPSVYFGFDQSSIAPAERSKLQQAADYLSGNPGEDLLVEGHCDWYGTAEYNLALGDRRASSVRDYLATLGISGDRIEVLSKGDLEARPGLSKTEAGEDRRADLIILR